jgi:tetratricopeptide (TPR) repeat protein
MRLSINSFSNRVGLFFGNKFVVTLLTFLYVCCLAAMPHSVGKVAAQTKDEGTQTFTLVVDQPAERDLKKDETHTYRITLKAGQYVNSLVESETLDTKIALLDPSGNKVMEVDWEVEGSVESLWAAAETTGEYKLQVSASASDWSHPRYEIKLAKVAGLETAPASDQALVKAHRLFRAANLIGTKVNADLLRQALKMYEETLPLWRETKNGVGEASSLDAISYLYYKLNDRERELAILNQAIPIWESLKNRKREQASAFYHLGSIYSATGKTSEALASLKRSLELARQIHNELIEFSDLNNLGHIYYKIGEFQAALDAHHNALSIQKRLNDWEGQARTLSNISAVYFGLGEYQEALNYCKQALPLRRKANDRRGEAITLANIGSNYRELGEPQIALEYYEQSVTLLHGVDDRGNESKLA